MADIFTQMMKDKNTIIESVLTVLQSRSSRGRLLVGQAASGGRDDCHQRPKDHLLELSIAGALTVAEFKSRSGAFNAQLRTLENQLATVHIEGKRQKDAAPDFAKIRAALDKELSFADGINSNLVATILNKMVVKKESTKEEIHLDIYLKPGAKFEAIFPSASFNCAIRGEAQGNRMASDRA